MAGRAVSGARRHGWRWADHMGILYLASLVAGLLLWTVASFLNREKALVPYPTHVLGTMWSSLLSGALLTHTLTSLSRVFVGFLIGILLSIPAGFLMGWYDSFRGLLEPWIQFLRTIPPIALTPLVIIFIGIGEEAKIFLIFLSTFLPATIAVFQGVRNVDLTLLKAARVLGAGDRAIFLNVVVPASFPYILVGMRIGLGSAWATLVASELIAATRGVGQMMQNAAMYFQVDVIMVGIIVIGCLGVFMDRGLLWLENRLTGWQEKRS